VTPKATERWLGAAAVAAHGATNSRALREVWSCGSYMGRVA